jgi:predicted CXXCH cytochrome family protein
VCHEPHASDHDGLAKKPEGRLCGACHQPTAGFRTAHGGYPVEKADCGQCHDPHASANPGLLRKNLHAPLESGDCSMCHEAADAANPFATNASQVELCGTCHEDQVEESRAAAFPHVSAGGGACVTCHNPHTADGSGLLKQPMEDLCVSCHNPGGALSGAEGRHITHGDGLACTTCHTAHGSDQPVLFVNDPITLCGACHSHQHGVTHPVGEGSRDPRTGQPMDCLSCHGLHDAPFPMYLQAERERELCVGCHRDLVRGDR